MSELYHYGIQGQKWGVRRYQNEDGSYTSEGKQRYGIGSDGRMTSEGRQIYRADKRIDRIATRSQKNYNKSMELAKTRSEAKTRYGKNILGLHATERHYKAEKQLIKANKLSQKYSNKFGYKQDDKMMSDLSKTSLKSNMNFNKTTSAQRAASIATSAAITAGSLAAVAFLGSPIAVISWPRPSTFNYRIKDEDKKVKVKDL